MGDEPRNDEEVLAWITAELAEVVLELSDDEVVAHVEAQGDDPSKTAQRTRDVIRRAIALRDQAKRRQHRRDYEVAVAALLQEPLHLAVDPKLRRSLLAAAVRSKPAVRDALTLQHRELTSLSDHDVDNQLKKLQQLGFIDQSGNLVGEEE